MLWIMIVCVLVLAATTGLFIIPAVIKCLDNKLAIERARASDLYNAEERKFVDNSDKCYREASAEYKNSESGSILYGKKTEADNNYINFQNSDFVDVILISDADDHLYYPLMITAFIVSMIALFIMVPIAISNHADYNVEKTIACFEVDKQEIVALVAIAEQCPAGTNSSETIAYQTLAMEYRGEAVNKIKSYNTAINNYIAGRKSPWTSWFVPEELTKIEKLDYQSIVASIKDVDK